MRSRSTDGRGGRPAPWRRALATGRRAIAGLLAGLCLLVGAPLGAGTAHGQPANIRFGQSEVLKAQLQNGAAEILQDRDGFMWFATDNGLLRFDGDDLTTYRSDPADSASISDGWVLALAQDAAGRLWAGTRNGGLNRFDPATQDFTHYPYSETVTDSSLRAPVVEALLLDREGLLWVGTIGGGLSRFDPETGRYTHFGTAPQASDVFRSRVYCLYEDRAGDIWIGSWDAGLARWDRETGTFTYYRNDPADPHSLSSNRIRAIVEGQEGYLWVATSGGGLNRFDPETGTFTAFKHDPEDPSSISHNVVWSLHEDSRGHLWAGTYGGGLNRFDRRAQAFTRYVHDRTDPYSLPSDVVLALSEDRSGLLWIATHRGVVTYNPARERVTIFRHDPADPHGLPRDHVLTVVTSEARPGTVWVGTNRGGLARFDRAKGRFETFRHDATRPASLAHDVVSAVAEDPSGKLWVGTKGGGLDLFDPATGRFTHHRNDPGDPQSLGSDIVSTVVVDRRGDVWVGTDGAGLDRLDRRTGVFEHFRHDPDDPGSIGYNSVSALLETSDGMIWMGTTDTGVDRIDPATGEVVHFSHDAGDSTSLSHDRVESLFEDSSGRLWVGTYAGLCRYVPGAAGGTRGGFVRYTTDGGLAGSMIFGITEDQDGMLWVSTNRGVSRLDPATGRIANLGEAAGLPVARYSPGAIARNRVGEILVGGRSGLSVFNPRVLQQVAFQPPLLVTAFKTFGETVRRDLGPDARLRLSHRDTYFSFEFALLEFTHPEEHTFRYRLEGFDDGWQEVEGPKGRVNYTNLDHRAGTFRFRVEGVDSRGRTSAMQLWLTIAPPWWRTSWFRVLCLFGSIALASGAVGFAYWRRRLEAAEKRRMLAEEREQERHFLARELHDVPLQNLYSVRHRLEVLERSLPLNGQSGRMEETRQMIEQTAEDLRRICGELRPPTLGPFGLSRAIRAHLRTIEQAHPELDVSFALDPDGQQLPEPIRLALFRIYQGAVSNAVRHAEARSLAVRLTLTDRDVVLEIEDDGRGFVVPRSWLELARRQHYGLLGISEWAEAAGGTLTVRSSPGEGALLQVRVPLGGEGLRERFAAALDRLGLAPAAGP